MKNKPSILQPLIAILCVTVIPTKGLGHGIVHERIDAATSAIESDPGNAELYARRANLWYVDESWDVSALDFARAIELGPASMKLRMGYARALRHAERFDEALAIYDACLQDEPESNVAQLGRARTLAGRGDRAEAARIYDKLAQDREHVGPEICTEHCAILAEMGDEHVDEAIRILDREMQRSGHVLPYQTLAVKLENQRGEYSAAASRLQVLIDLPGRDEFWLERQGNALLKAGRAEEAKDKFRSAMDAIRNLPPARRNTHAVRELSDQLNQMLSQNERVRP